MSFDNRKFRKTEFEPRTALCPVPLWTDFFEECESQITVRGLSLREFLRAKNASATNKDLDSIISALTNDQDKVQAIKDMVGLVSDNVPSELPYRLEMFVSGCVDPIFDLATAVMISDRYPIDFWIITQKIMELTGMGMQPKKLPPS